MTFNIEGSSKAEFHGGLVHGPITLSGPFFLSEKSGPRLDILGGNFARGVQVERLSSGAPSAVNLRGGTLGDATLLPAPSEFGGGTGGATFHIYGAEFRVDGVPISGLDQIGAERELGNALAGGAQLFTGVLSDGTPFAFSPTEGDVLGQVRLTRVALPEGPPEALNRIQGIETIDIMGGSPNTLRLDVYEVLNLSGESKPTATSTAQIFSPGSVGWGRLRWRTGPRGTPTTTKPSTQRIWTSGRLNSATRA